MSLRCLAILLASAPLWACDGRTVDSQLDDGGGGLPPAGDCVIAKKRSGCCVSFVPATRQEIESDPCLWAPEVTKDADGSCILPATCIVQCPPQRPPSRASTMRGGVCVFADECETDGDCVVVENCHDCCCGDVVAERAALEDACLFAEGEQGNECRRPCPSPCPAETASPSEMVARCELVTSPHGLVNACVPGG